jgi:hypothetical protein
MRTAPLARRELAATVSARGRVCLARVIRHVYAGGKGRGIADVEVVSLPSPIQGVAAFGFQVTGSLPPGLPGRPGGHAPLYEDTLGFVVGSAEIILETEGIPRPFPAVGVA